MNARLERLTAEDSGESHCTRHARFSRGDLLHAPRIRIGFCLLTAAAVFLADIQMPLDIAMGVPYVLVILVSLRLGDARLTYCLALLCTLLLLWGFYLSPDSGGRLDPNMILINRLAALLAIWASAFLGIRLTLAIKQREAALNEIKILKGRLPICAHCKKIRDGQEKWVQLEEYLLNHSEAIFSHSICPTCMDENFGEYT